MSLVFCNFFWQRCKDSSLSRRQAAMTVGCASVAIVTSGYPYLSIIYPAASWIRRAIRPYRLTIGLLQNPLMGTA